MYSWYQCTFAVPWRSTSTYTYTYTVRVRGVPSIGPAEVFWVPVGNYNSEWILETGPLCNYYNAYDGLWHGTVRVNGSSWSSREDIQY